MHSNLILSRLTDSARNQIMVIFASLQTSLYAGEKSVIDKAQ